MATIRKRFWKRGTQRLSAFVVSYTDADGRRRLQTFNSENAAVAFKRSITQAMARDKMKEETQTDTSEQNIFDIPLGLLWGVPEIAKFINRKPRSVYHMLKAGNLPAKKVGNLFVAKKSDLAKLFS